MCCQDKVKIEQTLKGCHSFSIYRIQVADSERAGREEALQKNGNILQGGLSHLSCQVALIYVTVRVSAPAEKTCPVTSSRTNQIHQQSSGLTVKMDHKCSEPSLLLLVKIIPVDTIFDLSDVLDQLSACEGTVSTSLHLISIMSSSNLSHTSVSCHLTGSIPQPFTITVRKLIRVPDQPVQ